MPIGWYIVPYKLRREDPGTEDCKWNTRYPEMTDYRDSIISAGGMYKHVEILGNRAIFKVRGPQAVLDFLDGKFKRLPKDKLNDPLSSLSGVAKSKIKNELLDMGYPLPEIVEKFGADIGQFTLKDVLKFMARRRLKPRYDKQADTVYVDGIVQKCASVERIDTRVVE